MAISLSIISQPQTDIPNPLLVAYVYGVSTLEASGDEEVVSVIVAVFLNGTQAAQHEFQPITRTASGGGFLNVFRCDIQSTLELNTSPPFHAEGLPVNQHNSESDYRVSVEISYKTATITTLGATSNESEVISSPLFPRGPQDLSYLVNQGSKAMYMTNGYSPTKEPKGDTHHINRTVSASGDGDSEYIYYYNDPLITGTTATSHFCVATYDSAGNQIDLDYMIMNATGPYSATPTKGYFAFGCGPKNINAATASNWEGSGLTIDSAVSYYIVTGGLYSINQQGIGSFSASHDTTAFNVQDCGETVRIQWLNQAGGIDFYNFKVRRKSLVSESITFEKTPAITYSDNDFGVQKLRAESTELLVISAESVSNSTGQWLNQIRLSPYVEEIKGDSRFSVVVQDAEATTYDEDGQIDVFLTIQYSQRLNTFSR